MKTHRNIFRDAGVFCPGSNTQLSTETPEGGLHTRDVQREYEDPIPKPNFSSCVTTSSSSHGTAQEHGPHPRGPERQGRHGRAGGHDSFCLHWLRHGNHLFLCTRAQVSRNGRQALISGMGPRMGLGSARAVRPGYDAAGADCTAHVPTASGRARAISNISIMHSWIISTPGTPRTALSLAQRVPPPHERPDGGRCEDGPRLSLRKRPHQWQLGSGTWSAGSPGGCVSRLGRLAGSRC